MKIETQRMHYFQLERQVYVVKCSQCILESIYILLFTLVWHFLIIHAHVFRCRWLEKLTCSGPSDNIKCKPKSPYSIEATLYIHVLYLSNWMMFFVTDFHTMQPPSCPVPVKCCPFYCCELSFPCYILQVGKKFHLENLFDDKDIQDIV